MTQIKQFQIERIENEIDFVLENIDYIYEPDITINKYQHHRSILFLLILVDIFMEVLLLAYFMRNSEYILLQLLEHGAVRNWDMGGALKQDNQLQSLQLLPGRGPGPEGLPELPEPHQPLLHRH
eukprot:CAMPEP_0168628524 /NCGR_PEP_ID=MMETSP0449_2-20121227/11897_1 /TAXON_ID=1082188 /ORGANISM="Strombidium rassoulzadegani, Strain ras09" /LENGTH=123 /DNA_ID=CAMNT_0008670963 /DNA_START=121 /DNA_END=492 /DNA_ORIENTATION=+